MRGSRSLLNATLPLLVEPGGTKTLVPPSLFTLHSASLAHPRQIPTPGRIRRICIHTGATPCAHLAAGLDHRPAWGSSGSGTIRRPGPVDMDSDLRGHSVAKIHPRAGVRIRTGDAGPDDRGRVGRPGLVVQGVEIARPGGGAEIIRGNQRREEYCSSKHDGTGHRTLCRRACRSRQLDVPSILTLDQPHHRIGSRGDTSERRIVRIRHLVRPTRTDDTDHRIRGIHQIDVIAIGGVRLAAPRVHHVVFNSEQVLLLSVGLVGVTQVATRSEEDPDFIRIVNRHRRCGRDRPRFHYGPARGGVVIEGIDHLRG